MQKHTSSRDKPQHWSDANCLVHSRWRGVHDQSRPTQSCDLNRGGRAMPCHDYRDDDWMAREWLKINALLSISKIMNRPKNIQTESASSRFRLWNKKKSMNLKGPGSSPWYLPRLKIIENAQGFRSTFVVKFLVAAFWHLSNRSILVDDCHHYHLDALVACNIFVSVWLKREKRTRLQTHTKMIIKSNGIKHSTCILASLYLIHSHSLWSMQTLRLLGSLFQFQHIFLIHIIPHQHHIS